MDETSSCGAAAIVNQYVDEAKKNKAVREMKLKY
jgi:hypothetical protein